MKNAPGSSLEIFGVVQTKKTITMPSTVFQVHLQELSLLPWGLVQPPDATWPWLAPATIFLPSWPVAWHGMARDGMGTCVWQYSKENPRQSKQRLILLPKVVWKVIFNSFGKIFRIDLANYRASLTIEHHHFTSPNISKT